MSNKCYQCVGRANNPDICQYCRDYQDPTSERKKICDGLLLHDRYFLGGSRKISYWDSFYSQTYYAFDSINKEPVEIQILRPPEENNGEENHTLMDLYAAMARMAIQLRKIDGLERFLDCGTKYVDSLDMVPELDWYSNYPWRKKQFRRGFGCMYIVREALDGRSLSEYCRSCGGKIELSQLIPILISVMRCLHRLHSIGVIHCNLNLESIFIKADGSVILRDPGGFDRQLMTEITHATQRRERRRASQQGMCVDFMLIPDDVFSPVEVVIRDKFTVSPRTDVYSLAGIIYACCSGEEPRAYYRPYSFGVGDWSLLPFSEEQVQAIHMALSENPEDRHPSIEAFCRDFLGEEILEQVLNKNAPSHC